MIYTLICFICLDICTLLIFVIFCLSEFINNCKSPVNPNCKSNLVIYHNKVSSQYSPGRKKPFLSNSRLRRLLLKWRKATVAKLNEETCPEFRDSFLAWNRVAFEIFRCYSIKTNNPISTTTTRFLHFTNWCDQWGNTQADHDKLVRKPPTNWFDQQGSEPDTQTGETIYRDQLISETPSQAGATKTKSQTGKRSNSTNWCEQD